MTQTIHCPSCQRMLRVPDNLLGQSVKCPSCDQTFTAPEEADAVPPPRPAARRPEPEEEERPARRLVRRPVDEEEDEDYRPARRRRHEEDDDEDEDYRRGDDKPGKVQAIAIMMLIGGIMALVTAAAGLLFSWGMSLCWPGTYFAIVMGIMATIKGSQLLGRRSYEVAPPSSIAILQIINIINCDIVNLTLGILALSFLSDEEVKGYFRIR